MNNFSQIGAKLLPFALIIGLVVVFQLLGVFSVQPGAVEPTRAAAKAPPSNDREAKPNAERKASVGAMPIGAASKNNGNINGNIDPVPISTTSQPAPQYGPGNSPPSESPRETPALIPRYIPPLQSGQTPLAGESMSPAGEPVELPNHEISEAEGQISEEQATLMEEQGQAPNGESRTSQ